VTHDRQFLKPTAEFMHEIITDAYAGINKWDAKSRTQSLEHLMNQTEKYY